MEPMLVGEVGETYNTGPCRSQLLAGRAAWRRERQTGSERKYEMVRSRVGSWDFREGSTF